MRTKTLEIERYHQIKGDTQKGTAQFFQFLEEKAAEHEPVHDEGLAQCAF